MNEAMIKDFIAVQKELKNPKNTVTNSFLKNKYAPLQDILNVVRPALNNHGFFLTQNIGTDNETNTLHVQTALLHESGEVFKASKMYATVKNLDPQKVGATITYFRRYQITTLLGIASEDDDDANSVSQDKKEDKPVQKQKPKRKPRPKKAEKVVEVSKSALKEIFKLSGELKKSFQPVVDGGDPVPRLAVLKKADELYAEENFELYKEIKGILEGDK